MTIQMDKIWKDYELGGLEQKLEELFPFSPPDLESLLQRLIKGDVLGCIRDFLGTTIQGFMGGFASLKQVLIWILVLGIAAALLSHFMEIFDNHQIADIGFYFTYLLMIVILMKCFVEASSVAVSAMENIVEFIQIFIPAYFLSIGVAQGSLTASAGYQILILIIYIVENVLLKLVLPLIYSYVLLSVINGLWIEERLTLLVESVEKGIRFLLKTLLGMVTGVSALQSMITPAIDSVKAGTLQKAIGAIPGVGDAADGVMETVVGSAVIIKNSLGIALLIILLGLAAAPLLQILITAGLIKAAAALLGIVSDKRITACTNKVGSGSELLFKTVGTAVLLFLITISIAAYTTNRGF
ncbi:MAG: stage III sporulation protein AE [Lachnospiraceae bacterium]|nr:stage III sporulation protein AE [Lachnospiraceae bacterium]